MKLQMQNLWDDKGCNLNDIIKKLSVDEEKNKNTIKTLLHRLIGKGAVESKKIDTREVVYIPKISKKKYLSKESDNFIRKLFNGSTQKLLLNFVEENKVSKDELKKLIEILEQDEEN